MVAHGSLRACDSSLHEERQPATMIEVSVGQEHIIDRRGVEAEGLGILFSQLPTALEHAAVDENAAIRAFEHMA